MTTTKTKQTKTSTDDRPVLAQAVSGKSWLITNNAGIDIVVIHASATSEDDTAELYGQTLRTLADSNGKKWIAKGASGTFKLDPDQPVSNLIIARANTLSPLKVIDAPDNDTTMPVSVSVSSSDVAAAGEAERFQQYIVAFPSSGLATGYADALNDDDPQAADKYLAEQEGYQNASLLLVVAFQSYYDRFPMVYAAYEKEHSYYLYTSDNKDITYIGSVLLENSNTAPLDTDSAPGKFKATFLNSTETRQTRLSWANGQFTDAADNPSICLRGLFAQRSTLTKDEADTALMAILGGKVNGKDVIVYDERVHKDKEGIYAALDVLTNPDSAGDYAILVVAGLVALAALVGLGYVCKKIRDRVKESNKTPEQIKAEKLEMIKRNRAETERIIKHMDPNAILPQDITISLAEYKKQAGEWLVKQQGEGIKATLSRQRTYYEAILDRSNNPAGMEKVSKNIEHIQDVLDSNAGDTIQPHIKDLIKTLKDNTKILNETRKAITYDYDVETRNLITNAKTRIERVTKQMDLNEADRKRIEDDEVPDTDIDIVEIEVD